MGSITIMFVKRTQLLVKKSLHCDETTVNVIIMNIPRVTKTKRILPDFLIFLHYKEKTTGNNKSECNVITKIPHNKAHHSVFFRSSNLIYILHLLSFATLQ